MWLTVHNGPGSSGICTDVRGVEGLRVLGSSGARPTPRNRISHPARPPHETASDCRGSRELVESRPGPLAPARPRHIHLGFERPILPARPRYGLILVRRGASHGARATQKKRPRRKKAHGGAPCCVDPERPPRFTVPRFSHRIFSRPGGNATIWNSPKRHMRLKVESVLK
jgi:hypothetical protein